ncbi:MAG TPA: RNA polymerase factor sigma-54 [Acidobacteriota bacterium]|jgi:RNA polymerase sigma-54 factor|nr:RNA polymerase factor sigma-54 [Acidobacteriota bacterium]HNT18330.1 RNA polymerase factor sigma-54 [Acidobacteriota bacterium]
MSLKQTISLKLQQKMVLTPSLQQAIRLLQLTRLELEGELSQELEKNPLLEDESMPTDQQPAETPESKREEREISEISPVDAMNDKIDVEAYFSDYAETGMKYRGTSYESLDDGGIQENLMTRLETLAEHLEWQAQMSGMSHDEEEVAKLIIGNLKADGYLDESLDTIAREAGRDYAFCEKVLSLVQRMDPIGVAARDLRECLLVQLRSFADPPRLAEKLVEFHLEELARPDFAKLAARLESSPEEVEEAVRVIKGLDPKPGLNFSSEPNPVVVPDAVIEKIGEEYRVTLNEDGLPKLRLSRYYQLLMERDKNPDVVIYLKDKLRSAVSFLKGVEERHKTIYNVVCQLVEIQRDFLEKGPPALKPLVLREIAERIGVHESTVSRVVSNKYVETPNGVIPLKDFFTTGIQTIEGRDISQQKVKSMIQRMIDDERPEKPLSDQQIAAALRREGILLARRTVAKYREEMKIPSSSQRTVRPKN